MQKYLQMACIFVSWIEYRSDIDTYCLYVNIDIIIIVKRKVSDQLAFSYDIERKNERENNIDLIFKMNAV